MDPNASAGNAEPVNPPPGGPPGSSAPAGGEEQPDHAAEVSALKSWLRENAFSLVISAVVIALVCVYLDPIDTLKVVLGLGFIIFIHELGHFLAAKWCDVHVNTFSIGFGPAVPFCSYKWGETTYKVGIIPLGGFVQMVGEGDGGDGEEDDDPRSFRKKSVGQRMLIISAGVVMNIVFGMACFVAAYLHGVQEKPAAVGWVESGGAAWQAGMRTGDHITRIGSRERPYFNDLRPVVMSSDKGERVPIVWERGVELTETYVQPIRDEGQRFPQLGIAPPYNLTLLSVSRRKDFRPVIPGSEAARAEPKFEPGDRVVAMTNPADPTRETAVDSYGEFHRRMVLLAKQPVTFQVLRKDQPDGAPPTRITVQPAYRHDLGMRMKMGEVVALRRGGPAEGKVQARAEGPPVTPGDRIVEVEVAGPNGPIRFAAGDKASPLDPLLLPRQLEEWAFSDPPPPSRAVKLTVLRESGHGVRRETLTLDYDPGYRFDRESVSLPNSPLAISALGLAYWVEAHVDDVTPGGPAAEAGVKPDDVITAVRFSALDDDGKKKEGDWKDDLKVHQWASADAAFQGSPPHEIDIRVKRKEGETIEFLAIKGRPDPRWGLEERGLIFQAETSVQKATDVGDAIYLGARRTVRFVQEVYMNLYAMVFGRVSAKTMSGPLTIANVSYKLAGEDFWQFLLFLGMISVNLAVVNFLPIPVLDGGHMVFLLLEKVLGRPVPEKAFAFAMYTGLFLILSLMVFVLWLDIRRLFFGWF